MKNAFRIIAAVLAFGASLAAWATVTASLDRDHLAAGETVRLLLQRDGSADGEPDLAPLKRDFEVLGSSRGSSIQIINGRASSQTQVDLVLAPKHDGTIRVPPLQWGGEMSPALELTVGGAGAAAPGAAAAGSSQVFLTATPDRNQAYVQAAVVLTVKLYADQPLYDASLELPASADVLVRQLGEDKHGSESRNGRGYQVIERKYLLFPQHSGQVHLGGPVLDAKLADIRNDDPFGDDPFFGKVFGSLRLPGFMNATRPVHLNGKPVELNVLPRPAGATGSDWLPAQNVTLEDGWRPENTSVRAGEPLTRHLRLAALGLTGAQLPELNTLMTVPDGIKSYPDQSRVEDKAQGATILGSREQDIALIARQPGRYLLPAVHLAWWDTLHDVRREAVLPSRTLDILPAVAGAGDPPASQTAKAVQPISPPLGVPAPAAMEQAAAAQGPPWPWISLALGLAWLGSLFAWWRSSRRTPPQGKPPDDAAPVVVDGGTAIKALRRACRDNDPRAARRHLLAWAAGAWPAPPALGLNALSRRLDDPRLAAALRELDRACYTDSAWSGEFLAASFPVPRANASAPEPRAVLPDLYPQTH